MITLFSLFLYTLFNLWHVILAQTWTHSMLLVLYIEEKYFIFSLKLFIVTVELMTLEGFFLLTLLVFRINLILLLFPRNMCLWVLFFCVSNISIQIVESYGIIAYRNTTQCMFLIHLRFYTLHNHNKSIEMILMYSLNLKYF